MKIYDIAIFLLMVNLSAGLLVSQGFMSATVETSDSFNNTYFQKQVDQSATYSDADVNLFSFGDFIRSLIMLTFTFAMGPTLIVSLMGAAGMPFEITSLLHTLVLVVYAAGAAQIIMRYSLEGNA